VFYLFSFDCHEVTERRGILMCQRLLNVVLYSYIERVQNLGIVLLKEESCEVRENTNKMQQLDVYYQHFLSMFRASLCPSSGEQDVCYCTTYNAAPYNHYQPHPAEPEQHTTCSNTRLVLLKMGIMMPETC